MSCGQNRFRLYGIIYLMRFYRVSYRNNLAATNNISLVILFIAFSQNNNSITEPSSKPTDIRKTLWTPVVLKVGMFPCDDPCFCPQASWNSKYRHPSINIDRKVNAVFLQKTAYCFAWMLLWERQAFYWTFQREKTVSIAMQIENWNHMFFAQRVSEHCCHTLCSAGSGHISF